jgi:hypothetical protein
LKALDAARSSRATPTSLRVLLHGLLACLVVACGTVHLISPYDAMVDSGVSDVHTKLVAFVWKMERLAGKPEGAYDANADFYEAIEASIATLRMRAAATPKSEVTVAQLDELSSNVSRLQKVHTMGKAGGLPKILGGPALSALDESCSAIARLEAAKRNGDNDGNVHPAQAAK